VRAQHYISKKLCSGAVIGQTNMEGFGLPLLDDDRLLELGMMVLHEILSRQLHASKKGVAKKKAPAKQKKAVAISDEEVSLTIDDLPDSYDSPAPTHAHDLVAPPAPRKKKAPAKAKGGDAGAAVVEECD